MPRVVCLVIYFPFELLVIRCRNDKSKVCCLLNKNCLTCPGRSRGRRTKKGTEKVRWVAAAGYNAPYGMLLLKTECA